MKMTLFNLAIIILISSCDFSDSVIEEKNLETNQESVISVKLKGREKILFNYTDNLLQAKELIFSNPGKTDTLITHKIEGNSAIILNWSYVFFENQRPTFYNSYVLLQPGDNLIFFLNNGKDLVLDSAIHKSAEIHLQKNNFFTITNPALNTEGVNQKDDFTNFYAALEQCRIEERSRINRKRQNNEIEQQVASIWLYNSDVLYYKYLFQFIAKESRLDAHKKEIYASHIKEALDLFRRDPVVLSHNLIQTFKGIIRFLMMAEDKDHQDPSLFVKTAIEIAPNPLRPALLTGLYTDDLGSKEGNKILSDYLLNNYSGTIYSKFISEKMNGSHAISGNISDDTLLLLNNQAVPWNTLLTQSDRYLIVDFWASWCAPCRELFPLLDSLKRSFDSKSVEFVSLNIDESIHDWRIASAAEAKYLKLNNYYLLQNRKSKLIERYSINMIPRLMIFKNGKLISQNFLLPSEPDFVDKLKKITSNE